MYTFYMYFKYILLIVLYDCKIKKPVIGARAQMPRNNLIAKIS